MTWIQYCSESNPQLMCAIPNLFLSSSIDLQDSSFVQGLQEGNLDLTVISFSSIHDMRGQNVDELVAQMASKQTASLLHCVWKDWNLEFRKASTLRYRDIAPSFFTISAWKNQCHRSQFCRRIMLRGRHQYLLYGFQNL